MGTLGIIREILFYIQGESNPIYVAEHREGAVSLPHLDFERWRSCLLFSLLVVAPILMLIEQLSGIRFSMYRDLFVVAALALVGGLLSLGWTAPLAMLAGQGISRERTAQTWNMLLVTPYPTDVILLAKASASVSWAWKLAVSLTFMASLPGLFIAGPVMLVRTLATGQGALLGVFFMGVGMVAIIAEREQEIALSVVVGIAIAFLSDSRRLALLLGLVGGLLIRLVQVLLTVLLVLPLAQPDSPNFALLNAAAGSATLLTLVPGFVSVLILVVLIAARELLIRALFAWTVRRAREG